MPKPLDGAVGQRMELDDYYADFERHFWRIHEFWKLECGQTFAEPGDDSWEAFNRGDWTESMRRLEIRRDDLLRYHRQASEAGVSTHRVRIVEKPLSAYLRWEFNLLRIRDETGGPIRVIDRSEVAEFEADGPLPEIYTFDDQVMYQAIYDDSGVLEYALKYTDSELIGRCQDFIHRLYDRGEPIRSYFSRELEGLPPARPERPLPDGYLDEAGRPGPIRS
jgi:hypothetical protein